MREGRSKSVFLRLQLRVERETDDGANQHNCSEYDQVMHARFHQRVNDVGGDQELQAEQKVVTEHMAKSPALILNVRAACALDLAPEKAHHTAGDTEDNHQHTENADPETDMVKEFHRMAYPPKRESTGSLVVQTNAVTLRIML